ncbi:DUF11 domain-containing protein [cf. Phormidesmis sp. LEGE 11477]|uniref:DUF11 domain-containing protein n=1 Tax=cf. Phormidesmis sp. LEGE 11477 TaxID=1828680 RepID=UPI001882BE0C|nr:DUF11 domain-containing protein [cf. Phormidesmis sp. LEGE 11477]MBE9064392.1 DUF11 domain-containing protein [cf. Phormidesmis sp. LEGE 11477]
MKRKFLFGMGIAALAATAPFAMSTPVFANLQEAGTAIVQQLLQPEVKLEMGAEKQVTVLDEDGQPKLAWQALGEKATVQPGDVLRYAVVSSNEGEMAAKNLVITQPIPAAMTYVIGSEKGNTAAAATYSIDNGETFVAEPMVEVKLPNGEVEMQPAPAEAYTHVKWAFNEDLESSVAVNVSHEVVVK